jgi:hypothetical protein
MDPVGTRAGARRQALRIGLGLVLVVDLAVLGTDAFLLSHRTTTTRVDLDDALSKYRAASGSTAAPIDESASTSTSIAAAPPSSAVTGATPTSSADTSSSVPTRIPVSSAPATPSSGPPSSGVYAYATTGGEAVSILGAHHDYPALTYASVHPTGGCRWEIDAEVVQEHVDERQMCTGDGSVSQLSQSRRVTFFGTTDGGTYTCAPPQVQLAPGDQAGSHIVVDCGDGKGSTAHLVRTTVGFGTATVGGQVVAVVRIRVDGTLTGRIRGASQDLLTLVAATGLPVHWQRMVDTMAQAFGTNVHYVEHATFDLQSLVPQT